ncbi:MAG: hypothetical protein SGJ11_10375 [Phycisphaerae bacterium]|nr:hypothetical protein [Phycisphaerae bacterium]
MPASTRTKRPVRASRQQSSSADARRCEQWLMELTSLPTAAGKEQRVVAWITSWVKKRAKDLSLDHDTFGNLLITQQRDRRARTHVAPVWFQAHLDHPAFVVRDISVDGDRRALALEFRGGVHNPYFENAKLEIVDSNDRSHRATITSLDADAKPFKVVTARLATASADVRVGDVGRWLFPRPAVRKGLTHTHACDDLAAVAAALCALDRVRSKPACEHVGLLFTRAEEVGFLGTIGAARSGTLSDDARIICIENSRSFAESPIGAGPILRVGDRRSVFTPELTNRIGDLLLAHQKLHPEFRFQRKLMAGGSCEATAFASYGYRSTCVCLPLGNYHNMEDIDGVLAGARPAKVGREFVSIADFHGLIAMLEIIAHDLDSSEIPPTREVMETIWKDLRFVLGEPA